MKAWFLSDIHIKNPTDANYFRLLSFLSDRVGDQTTHLFFVGDIFDLWVGGDSFFSSRYGAFVAAVEKLVSVGVKIEYFEGNHDLHLAKFWKTHGGAAVRIHVKPEIFALGSWKVRVEHGDQMNPQDTGYIFLRSVLRTAGFETFIEALPGRWIQAIGDSMSRTSRKWTTSELKRQTEEVTRQMIRAHAKTAAEPSTNAAKASPFDLLVSGHVHVQDDFSWQVGSEGETKNLRSINLGSWLDLDQDPQVFKLDDTGAEWVTLGRRQ